MKPKSLFSDKFSTLPQPIIETILCLVPIRDAVRTSVLSKKWRYKWSRIPNLVFNEETMFKVKDMFEESSDASSVEPRFKRPPHWEDLSRRCKFFYAIQQVLLMHRGPTLEFTLSMEGDSTCVEIDQIITYLSRDRTINKFTLDLTYYDSYDLPSSFFSLHQLTHLHIHNCDFYPGPTFGGFRNLTSLYIYHVGITDATVVHLLSNTHLLKSFTFVLCDDCVIGYDFLIYEVIKSLPVVEYLCLSMEHLEYHPEVRVPKELPTALVHLKSLFLCRTSFFYKCQLSFLFCLIRSSPNLEKLKLQMKPEDQMPHEYEIDASTFQDYSDVSLEYLNELEIEKFGNVKPDLEFVKLILAKSPVLKKVRITLDSEVTKDEEMDMLSIFSRFPRASEVVDIIVEYNPKYAMWTGC